MKLKDDAESSLICGTLVMEFRVRDLNVAFDTFPIHLVPDISS